MAENSSDRGDALSTAEMGSLGGEAAWRRGCRILLLLLNSYLILQLLWLNEAWLDGAYPSTLELLLRGFEFGSPIAMAIATVLASRRGGWLGLSPILSSLLMVALSYVVHFAILGLVIIWGNPSPTVWLIFLLSLIPIAVATISTGLLLWVNAPIRR